MYYPYPYLQQQQPQPQRPVYHVMSAPASSAAYVPASASAYLTASSALRPLVGANQASQSTIDCGLTNGTLAKAAAAIAKASTSRKSDPEQYTSTSIRKAHNKKVTRAARKLVKKRRTAAKRPSQNPQSKYRCVRWYKRTSRWVVQVRINGERKHVGYFDKEEDAAAAYHVALEKWTKKDTPVVKDEKKETTAKETTAKETTASAPVLTKTEESS
jgi:hypothetical protein